MIQTSSAFATANAALNKKPVWLLTIENYWRSFANVTGLSALSVVTQSASQVVDFGGLEDFPSTVTFAEPVTAGDPIFVFEIGNGLETMGLVIDDTGGNTWTTIYDDGTVRCWSAIANATGVITISVQGTNWASRGTHGEIAGGNFEIYAVEVPATYAGFHGAGASGTSGTASVTAGSTTVSFAVNNPSFWDVVLIELAPASGSTPALTILFAHVFITGGAPPGSFIIGAASAQVYGNGPVYDWLVNIADLKITVSDLDGGADLGDLVFNVQDHGQAITGDMPSFTFEGKVCRLLHGFVGMNVSDYATLFTGTIDTVESDNGNNEYQFTVSDINLKKLTQKIYTQSDADVNGNTFTVDSTHPRSINGHPLDILVSALEQAGVNLSSIDTAKIYYYRDRIFPGRTFVFSLTSAPTAKDFIENEIMKPMGMYMYANNLGTLTITSFYPAISAYGGYTPPTPPVLTAEVSTNPSDYNQNNVPLVAEADLVNQVIFDFDDDGTGSSKFLSEEIVDYDASIAKYGLVGGQTIQSQGMRSSFQGHFMAQLIGGLIALRYGLKTLVLDPLSLTWNSCILEPGDIIAVTNPFVPDRTLGALGVTAKEFEVMDRTWKFMGTGAGTVEVRLLATDLSKFKQYLYTPNGEADYAAAGATDQGKYMFLCGANDEYSTGAAANTLG